MKIFHQHLMVLYSICDVQLSEQFMLLLVRLTYPFETVIFFYIFRSCESPKNNVFYYRFSCWNVYFLSREGIMRLHNVLWCCCSASGEFIFVRVLVRIDCNPLPEKHFFMSFNIASLAIISLKYLK